MSEIGISPASIQLGGGDDDVFKNDRNTPGFAPDKKRHNSARSSVKFRRFTRAYIISQLRKHNFDTIADKHVLLEETDDSSQLLLHHLAGNLADERQRQFEDILDRLQLTNDNLSETYQTIVTEIFRDDVNWGRVLAFLVFSGSLAVYCAQQSMEERVGEVISWTEDDMQRTVSSWIMKQGGWAAFVEHFDDSWTIEIPHYLLAGVVAAVLAGGIFLLKKLF